MSRSRGRKTIWITLVAALALPLTAAGPVAAQNTPGARDTTRYACPPDQVPPSGFTDTQGNTFEDQIDCLAWYGITTGGAGGRPANEYAPRERVSREQMATFIVRWLDYVDPNLLPPYDGTNDFSDVSANNVHLRAINRLAQAGIALGGVGGAPADRYGPGQTVQRDQMASFVARAVGFVFVEDLCSSLPNYFDDDNGRVHEPCINALADTGIVQGTAARTYSPGRGVTRDQMAGFLMRAMDLLVEQELTQPPS